MSAVFRREFHSYFRSVLGYVFLAIFFFFSGLYFYLFCLSSYGSSNMTYLFRNLFQISVFLMPILTMRIWSEDKKQKTEQLLLTSPTKLISITLGKYFAALSVFVIGMSSTLIFALFVSAFADPVWPVVILNFVGVLLLGCVLISIGMFISSLTESQLIAALISFAVSFLILMFNTIASLVPVDFIKTILNALSFSNHYQSFMQGLLSIPDVVFFLSVAVLFIFFNIRVIEKKRWS